MTHCGEISATSHQASRQCTQRAPGALSAGCKLANSLAGCALLQPHLLGCGSAMGMCCKMTCAGCSTGCCPVIRLIDMREFTSQAHKLGLEMDMEVGGEPGQAFCRASKGSAEPCNCSRTRCFSAAASPRGQQSSLCPDSAAVGGQAPGSMTGIIWSATACRLHAMMALLK